MNYSTEMKLLFSLLNSQDDKLKVCKEIKDNLTSEKEQGVFVLWLVKTLSFPTIKHHQCFGALGQNVLDVADVCEIAEAMELQEQFCQVNCSISGVKNDRFEHGVIRELNVMEVDSS